MRNRFLSVCLILTFVLAFAGSSSAYITENVQLDFASGATWVGSITFNDGYEGMIDTEGYLNGGTNGYPNVFFSWTWWQGNSYDNPQDYLNNGYYNDWLMDGSFDAGYSYYIGLSWDPVLSASLGAVQFALFQDPYANGWEGARDLIVGWNENEPDTNPVPEPSTAVILGFGLVATAFLGRGRKRS